MQMLEIDLVLYSAFSESKIPVEITENCDIFIQSFTFFLSVDSHMDTFL